MRFNGYYRVLVPLRELEKHGHEVTYMNQYHDPVARTFRESSDMWDVIIAERLTAYKDLSAWRSARKGKNRLVYENDDDIFSITLENWVAYNVYKQADVREAVQAMSEAADMVTVTVEPLAEVFREFNPRVAVLPNCVPELAFTVVGDQQYAERPLRVGWVGGASHGRDVHECTDPVRRFFKRFPDWQFYNGGTDYRPTFKVPIRQTYFEKWHHVLDDEEAYFGSFNFDIGIAPLFETKFVRSKSAIKCIEYGARGIPVVASNVTPYQSYITHGENGFLAKTEHEWLEYLTLLARDETLRKEMGAKAKAKAREFSIERNWQKWEQAYEGLFRRVNA